MDGRKCDQLESITLLEEAVRVDVTIKKVEQMISDQLNIQSEEPDFSIHENGTFARYSGTIHSSFYNEGIN